MKRALLHVTGTHCDSCKILIEDTLNKQAGIKNTQVDLKKRTVSFDTEREESLTELAEHLTGMIEANGYRLSTEEPAPTSTEDGLLWQALPIGLVFLALFFLVQRSGILDLGLGGSVTPVTAFIIGLIASVSSCLAVVGGLVLSLSASIARGPERSSGAMALFHLGRMAAFAILGGVLGAIGSAISISITMSIVLGVVASTVMLILGLHLVGVFKRNLLALPTAVFRSFQGMGQSSATPFLVGVGTFFLPCGFTQAMQVVALSSGSFVSGALTMTAFAFGTLPVLLVLSFGTATFARSKHAPLFFKSAGIVVIGLGLFTFLGGLAALGIIEPLFNL